MSLAERFAKSKGAPQNVDGLIVHSIYRRQISAGARVRVRRVSAAAGSVQGLRIKMDNGFLLVNERRRKDVVLWSDTAPAEVEVVCEPRGAVGELRAWNCWRDAEGTMHAWIGDAGIVVEEAEAIVRLRCSAGYHPFAPSDLEVVLTFG